MSVAFVIIPHFTVSVFVAFGVGRNARLLAPDGVLALPVVDFANVSGTVLEDSLSCPKALIDAAQTTATIPTTNLLMIPPLSFGCRTSGVSGARQRVRTTPLFAHAVLISAIPIRA